ncbi:MAG: hypothetical protein IKW89_12025 [Bacteroidales bacterium]|nr:hypothetical protein [Bacteroidales bacterium]
MRRIEHIRTAIAVLLLSVVLPMTLVLPFHHHETGASSLLSCEQCTNHQPHPGHMGSSDQQDDCLVCQFLSVAFLPEDSVDAPFRPECTGEPDSSLTVSVHSAQVQTLSSRAPPSSFC